MKKTKGVLLATTLILVVVIGIGFYLYKSGNTEFLGISTPAFLQDQADSSTDIDTDSHDDSLEDHSSIGGVSPDKAGTTVAEQTAYLQKNGCRTDMTTISLGAGQPPHPVFALLEDVERPTWHHDVNDCLYPILSVAKGNPNNPSINDILYYQTMYELAQKNVLFYKSGSSQRFTLGQVLKSDGSLDTSKFDRIVYGNSKGVAYESQVQVDMGEWLVSLYYVLISGGHAQDERLNDYNALGLAVSNVLLDPVSAGGLRSQRACDLKPSLKCSFFYAVTNPDRGETDEGATLNKYLQAVRDIFDISNQLSKTAAYLKSSQYSALAKTFRDASAEGVNQLVYSSGTTAPGLPPSLLDYVPKNTSGQYIQNSWLYYGMNPVKDVGHGYFLKTNRYKDCGYDVRNLTLLESIFHRFEPMPGVLDLSGFTQPNPKLGSPILAFMLKTYDLKVHSTEGLYADSPTQTNGNFWGCSKDHTNPIAPDDLMYLENIATK